MNIKRLWFENFMAIGSGEILFDDSGVRLIEGINNDSPTSTSNGAGKSSIPEGLQWVIYGTTRRGLKGDEIVNNRAKKDCLVGLDFDNHRIIRTRKHETYGTALHFFEIDTTGASRELTLGTMKDTQALIEQTIKLSELTFSKIAYFGQGDIKGFAGLTDSELKKVFEQALNLTFFSEYHAKAKGERVRLETALSVSRATLAGFEQAQRFAAEKIALLEKSLSEHEANTTKAITDTETDIERINAEQTNVIKTATEEVKRAADEIAELKVKTVKLSELENLRVRLEEKRKKTSVERAVRLAELRAVERQLQELKNELEQTEALVGSKCKECGKVYEEDDLEAAREALAVKIESKESECVAKRAEVPAADEEERLKTLADQLGERIGEFAGSRERLSALETHVAAIKRSAKSKIDDLTWRRRQAEERILDLKASSTSASSDLELAQKELENAKISALRAQYELDNISEDIETAKVLEGVLSSDLKSYVFDSVTPELNRLVDANIKRLDDIDIEISTVKRLKSGDFREKFSIQVGNKHGAEVFHGNSGGEQQKINLAISLAINKLVRGMAEKPINCIFLDEAFENLDDGSSEAVTELIKSVDSLNVFLITHRSEIKELVAGAIKVEKSGGVATIH